MEKETIFLIEDDAFFRKIISKKLEKEGFGIAQASDGKEAFDYLERNTPSLILLDILLPGMNGFEILSIIKKQEKTSSIPVIMLSNMSQKEDVDKAMSLGADDFLIKVNFVPEEIIDKIKENLQKKYLK